jgi:hypothetical protein
LRRSSCPKPRARPCRPDPATGPSAVTLGIAL